MITQFKTLVAVTVAHAYYSGKCEDVAFIIPADTAQLLRNGKLLAKELEGKLYLLFEADEAGVALKPIPGQTLRIGLRLINLFFSNFTQLDASFASSTQLYRNSAAPAALDAPVKVQLVGRVFSHVLTDSARPVTVTMKDKAGVVLQNDEVTAAFNRLTVSYDLTGLAPGAYSVEEDYPSGPTQNSYYSDPELLQVGVFALIELEIAAGFYSAAAPPEFELVFNARQETLRYYVVASNYSVDQLSVSDAGWAEDGRSQIIFDKIASDSLSVTEKISRDLLGSSSTQVVLFKSHDDVARAERPRKKIQLKRNTDVLITHLPQPGPEKATADLIIPISKP